MSLIDIEILEEIQVIGCTDGGSQRFCLRDQPTIRQDSNTEMDFFRKEKENRADDKPVCINVSGQESTNSLEFYC